MFAAVVGCSDEETHSVLLFGCTIANAPAHGDVVCSNSYIVCIGGQTMSTEGYNQLHNLSNSTDRLPSWCGGDTNSH